MQLPQPYLFTSPRMIARIDQAQMAPREAPQVDSTYGYHTLWAAEVPFIPAHVGKDDRDLEEDATHRITRVLGRQVRFLYDLAQSRDYQSTFELRLVCWPQPEGRAQVGIVFLAKTFHSDEQTSQQLALGLWDKFSAIFPHEAPFSYPLVPVRAPAEATSAQSHTFAEWYEPIPFEKLVAPQNIVELRKYEDWPTIRGIGGVLHARDYIPHPFVPALDYSAMARLFETMARQREVCMVSITLRPQRLTDQEVVIFHELAGWYQRAANGEIVIDNPLVDVLRELKSNVFESYMRSRAQLGVKVYERLVREQRSLFLVRLQVIGSPFAQDDLVEALGSEVMANAGSEYPSRWTRVEPAQYELRWARFNLQWLEFERWGISPLIQQYAPIVRLRQLATVQEAAGAFRLPVAPSVGGLAGLMVRDEPFSLPAITSLDKGHCLQVGMLMDRGVPTGLPFLLPHDTLSRLAYIFGEANQLRERVLVTLFAGTQAYGIPWVFIRAREDLDGDATQKLQARYVSIDALSSTPGIQIDPFLPPPGVSLSQYLDALLRVFLAAYKVDIASGTVLRRALLSTYEEAGWTETQRGGRVDLSTLAGRIEALANGPEVPAQTATMLCTRCVLPLRDLSITAASVFAPARASEPTHLWSEPTIFDIGWLGSDISTTLVRGCLWAWLSLAASATSAQPFAALVGLEDAHALFGSVTERQTSEKIASPMISLALSLARRGVGMLLVDSRPDLLDADFVSRAGVTFLTRNMNMTAQQNVTSALGISQRQQMRIRRLNEREVVVAVRGTNPVLVAL